MICRVILGVVILLLSANPLNAQFWACLNGDSKRAVIPKFDNQISSSKSNVIGARTSSSGGVIGGSYYLFGGYGFDKSGHKTSLNDLWRYDILNDKWVWLSGDTGIKFVQKWNVLGKDIDISVCPSPRAGACSWVYNDRLYIFGGTGLDTTGSFATYNQIWRYDPFRSIWEFICGDSLGSTYTSISSGYRSLKSDLPSARSNPSCWMVNGKVYLLGGLGWNRKNALTNLSDFWCYDIASNYWEELSADSSIYREDIINFNMKRSYYPYFIHDAATWVYNNYLILYGGKGFESVGKEASFAQMWVYDIYKHTWFIKSAESRNRGFENSFYNTEHPGLRSNSTTWSKDNVLYLYGGNGVDGKGETGRLNDLWSFDYEISKWERIHGDVFNFRSTSAIVDAKKNYSVNNNPGARVLAMPFVHDNGLFLFGGFVNTYLGARMLNDLWRFNITQRKVTKKAATPVLPGITPISSSTAQISDNTANYEGTVSDPNITFSDDIYFAPNPVRDQAYIFSSHQKQAFQFIVTDLNGMVLLEGKGESLIPYVKHYFDFTSLKSGNYFLELVFSTQSTKVYFTKQ